MGPGQATLRRLAAAVLGLAVLLPAAGALAQPAAGGLGSHDSSLPIEIVADRLTVEQAQGRAIFQGNVQAEQGEMLLRSDRLVVYYQLGDDGAASSQAIRRIEVEGNVTIASAAETAVGRSGFYDVVGGTIVLAGDVVLTREANVIRGDRLEIDLAQELATMTAAEGPTGGRVRALFQPSSGGEG